MKARTSDRASYTPNDRILPRVWVLQGRRTGDNLQVQALADGLGWPWESKSLTWQRWLPRWTPLYGRSATLKHLTPAARDTFKPPWPDLVLSIGWRSVPVARWVQQNCAAKLVHLGRPRAPLDDFDLVLTTPQYRLPDAHNVVQLNGPLTTLSADTLAASAQAWQGRLVDLPRPWIAVLVGGDTPTLRFPPSAAAALIAACNQLAADQNGSLLVATSPRTSSAVTEVMRDAIQAPSLFHQWRKDADNPYAAFLALADQFIVTNDSISMTHEAALTRKPLRIFPLSAKENRRDTLVRRLDQKLRNGGTGLSRAYLDLIRRGMIFPPKSPADYFQALKQNGHADVLGSTDAISEVSPMLPENGQAVQAVQQLFKMTQADIADGK